MATGTPETLGQLAADSDDAGTAMRAAFRRLHRLVERCGSDDSEQVPTVEEAQIAVLKAETAALRALNAQHAAHWALLPAQVRARAEERTTGPE